MFSNSEISFPEALIDTTAFPWLAFTLLPFDNVDAGIFSRITMTSMTSAWYLPLSHFEALFVALVVLEIIVMRYFLILPLDVTKLIEDGTLLQTSVSRKKRMIFEPQEVLQQQRLAETIFTVLRRLDQHDCVLRTLCELEYSHSRGKLFSTKVLTLLSHLKRLGYKRIKAERMTTPSNETIPERKVLSVFEDAVLLGTGDNTKTCEDASGESCASHFPLCNAKEDELLNYVYEISPFLM